MNQLRKVLKKIYERMIDEEYSNDQKEILEYIFIGCSFEIIKLIIIFGILAASGWFSEGLIVGSVMFFSKPFIGGYHEETQFRCLISTVISIFFIIIISKNSNFTALGNFMILILSIFCLWNKAPVIDSKRPLTKVNLINRNRIIGTIILIVFGVISLVIYGKSEKYLLITWTIIFQVITLFRRNMKLIDKNEINN